MIIGIDASRADMVNSTGTENYSFNLIKYFAKLDKSNSYILYSRKKLNNELAPENLGANFSSSVISMPFLWTQLGLSLKMAFGEQDVLFVPSHAVPIIHPQNTIVTIHGLEYEYYPENYTLFGRNYLRQSTIFSARHARKIIVPSNSTKRDLVDFYKINPDKITVIYHGANQDYKKHKEDFLAKNNREKNYILFIGRIEERKNITRLVEAFNFIKKRNSGLKDLRLILAGKKGIGFDRIKKTISNSPFLKDIIIKGYVTEEEKNDLLNNALIFAYPSLYEGFGMPILEAQFAGVPVVSSSVASIPEVAGKGAVLIDPKSVNEIADVLYDITANSNLRDDLIKRGFENIKRFSWEKCARETLNVLMS